MEFDKLCRLCLQPEKKLVNIFSPTDQDNDIASKIHSCVAVKVSADGTGPKNICTKCLRIVETWSKFKELCDTTNYLVAQCASDKRADGMKIQDIQKELHKSPILSHSQVISEDSILDMQVLTPDVRVFDQDSLLEGCLYNISIEENNHTDEKSIQNVVTTPCKQTNESNLVTAAEICEVVIGYKLPNDNGNSTKHDLGDSNKSTELVNEDSLGFTALLADYLKTTDSERACEETDKFSELKTTSDICEKLPNERVSVPVMEENIGSAVLSDNQEFSPTVSNPVSSGLQLLWVPYEYPEVFEIQNSAGPLLENKFIQLPSTSQECTTPNDSRSKKGRGRRSRPDSSRSRKRKTTGENVEKTKNKKRKDGELKKPKTAYSCEICDKSYNKFSKLLYHDYSVHATLEKTHPCEECGRLFITLHRLEAHKHSHRDKTFTCELCGKIFLTNKSLFVHKKRHTGNYKCHICDYAAACASELNLHIKAKHELSRFECTVCDKKFHNKSSYKRHSYVHSDSHPEYKCLTCSMLFTHLIDLKRHKTIHQQSPERFICHLCGESLKSKRILTKHLKRHSGLLYRCTVCATSFDHSYQLNIHLAEHSEIEPIICEICSKRYYHSVSFVRHLYTHI